MTRTGPVIAVNGRRLAHVEMGRGDRIVFLRGDPASSRFWRDVRPKPARSGRMIARDLLAP